jgi:uroporphyrin-III C-methyltransferase
LVGAGPGDPELLTLRAQRALAEADLVLYDALVDASVLDLAPRARRFYVGKRAGRHALAQREIERVMVRAASRGLVVVRLKAGDPFVFGRGGEEVLAAREAGIPVEVIPGVSSAFAAPASAGIPVTHRELARGVLVLTASPSDAYRSVLPALAHAELTVVLLMGLAARGEIASFLIEHGWAPSHPAAIVIGATTPRAFRWTGTLAELGAVDVPSGPPGVLVLGATVRLAAGAGLALPGVDFGGGEGAANIGESA